MIVGMWMTKDVESIGPKTPIPVAAALMSRRKIRRLPIVEVTPNGPHPVGIVSSTDIYHAFPSNVNPFSAIAAEHLDEGTTVAEIHDVETLATVGPETPIEEAARVMSTKKIGAVLVVRKEILGLITESDIFRAFVSFFDVSSGGARITFDAAGDGSEFATVAKLAALQGVRVTSLINSIENGRPVCVIRVAGAHTPEFLESIWTSGHKVLNVVRY